MNRQEMQISAAAAVPDADGGEVRGQFELGFKLIAPHFLCNSPPHRSAVAWHTVLYMVTKF